MHFFLPRYMRVYGVGSLRGTIGGEKRGVKPESGLIGLRLLARGTDGGNGFRIEATAVESADNVLERLYHG